MISTSSLVLDGHHGHGLGPGPGLGGPHHMTFVDPYLRTKLPATVPEFMRPFAKPAPIVPRFGNQRPSPSQSPRKDYPGVPVTSAPTSGPVNLTSVKMDSTTTLTDSHIPTTSVNIHIPHLTTGYSPRMYPPPSFPYPGLQSPYGGLYPSPYSSLLNRPFMNSSPLSPLEGQFSPSPQNGGEDSTSPRLYNQTGYQNTAPSTPSQPPPKPNHSVREKRPFKVPALKETPVGKQRLLSASKSSAKRVTLMSNVNNNNYNNNNNLLPANFTKGSLIQLANGDLRRVEDVTTEELVTSAEKCPAFRLDPSTVVRISENNHGTVLLTLSYGDNKKTIEMESSLEYPYFVYGQGWTSCSPERTMTCYGLQCSQLKVGDICLSLSPRQAQGEGEDRSGGGGSSSTSTSTSTSTSSKVL